MKGDEFLVVMLEPPKLRPRNNEAGRGDMRPEVGLNYSVSGRRCFRNQGGLAAHRLEGVQVPCRQRVLAAHVLGALALPNAMS